MNIKNAKIFLIMVFFLATLTRCPGIVDYLRGDDYDREIFAEEKELALLTNRGYRSSAYEIYSYYKYHHEDAPNDDIPTLYFFEGVRYVVNPAEYDKDKAITSLLKFLELATHDRYEEIRGWAHEMLRELTTGKQRIFIGIGVLDNVEVRSFRPITIPPLAPHNMVRVPGGCYAMGNIISKIGSLNPIHAVCLDDFYIDKYEVTQKEYVDIMHYNPSYFLSCGSSCPVENVSWQSARTYCEKVGKRLPTEAEWQYAARSGGKNEIYSGSDNIDEVAWYKFNSGGRTHPVGQKKPNGLGIYDMTGNVSEWVNDWYDELYNHYIFPPLFNPQGTKIPQKERAVQGGGWSAERGYTYANFGLNYLSGVSENSKEHSTSGFRCAK